MTGYRKKDRLALAYDANKKRIRTEGTIILNEVLNSALAEMDRQFQEAVNRGELLSIVATGEEMRAFLRDAAARELGSDRAVDE